MHTVAFVEIQAFCIPYLTFSLCIVPGGNRTKAHKVWIETRDAAAALSLLDRRPSAERDVLSGLKARGADCYKEAMGQVCDAKC